MTGGGAPPPTDTPTPTLGLRPSVAHPASIRAPIPVSSNFFIISPPDLCGLVRSRFLNPGEISLWEGRHRPEHTIGSVEQTQCLFLPSVTTRMSERFLLRNLLIIQPVPCLNLGCPCQAILPRSSCWLCSRQFFVFFRQLCTREVFPKSRRFRSRVLSGSVSRKFFFGSERLHCRGSPGRPETSP